MIPIQARASHLTRAFPLPPVSSALSRQLKPRASRRPAGCEGVRVLWGCEIRFPIRHRPHRRAIRVQSLQNITDIPLVRTELHIAGRCRRRGVSPSCMRVPLLIRRQYPEETKKYPKAYRDQHLLPKSHGSSIATYVVAYGELSSHELFIARVYRMSIQTCIHMLQLSN